MGSRDGTSPETLKRLYWHLSDEEKGSKMVSAASVPFGLGAECPHCPVRAHMISINRITRTFKCSEGGVHPFPDLGVFLEKTQDGWDLVERKL